MKKLFLLLIAALAMLFGTCWGAGTTQAKETSISSRGSIIYQQDDMKAALYADDLDFLRNKLSTIPENTFDPCCYFYESGSEKEDDIYPVLYYRELVNGQTASGEEQEEDVEISVQTETGDIFTSIDISEEDLSETEGTENISDSTDPSEENSTKTEDSEDSSASAGSSEGNPSADEDSGDISTVADLSEGNSSVEENEEDTSTSADPSAENPSEMENTEPLLDLSAENLSEIGDAGEQIVLEE